MVFKKDCEECGKGVDIHALKCPKCGFDFSSSSRVSPKCPYCEKELHLDDFYIIELNKKGEKIPRGFLGEYYGYSQLWYCPFCGKILGFTGVAT